MNETINKEHQVLVLKCVQRLVETCTKMGTDRDTLVSALLSGALAEHLSHRGETFTRQCLSDFMALMKKPADLEELPNRQADQR